MEDVDTIPPTCQRCGFPLGTREEICSFCDETEEFVPRELTTSRVKASTIFYVLSVCLLFLGVMVPLVEMMVRPGERPDTLIEMLEWNLFSQLGLASMAQGLFMFSMGLMADRRGA